MDTEIWKDIPEYDRYQVSNHGRMKRDGDLMVISESGGYKCCTLRGEKNWSARIHAIVMLAFVGDRPIINGSKAVIDHKDHDRTNNHLQNLQYISQQENVVRSVWRRKCKKSSSKFKGVCWDKSRQKWIANVAKNGKTIYIGRFKTELEAYRAYLNKIQEMT